MKDADTTRELLSVAANGKRRVFGIRHDTGRGLPPQQADQVFSAFFTTKLAWHG